MPPTMQAFLGYKSPETLALGLVEGKIPAKIGREFWLPLVHRMQRFPALKQLVVES
jgi:hypothetical protein